MEARQRIVGAYLREIHNMLETVVYRDMEHRLGILHAVSDMIHQTTGSRPLMLSFVDDRPGWMSRPSDVDRMNAVLQRVQARVDKLHMFAMHQELGEFAQRLYNVNIMLKILLGDDDIPEAGRDGMITPAEGEQLLNPRNLDLADEEGHIEAEAYADALDQRQFSNLDREVALVEQAAREWQEGLGEAGGEEEGGEEHEEEQEVWG